MRIIYMITFYGRYRLRLFVPVSITLFFSGVIIHTILQKLLQFGTVELRSMERFLVESSHYTFSVVLVEFQCGQ